LGLAFGLVLTEFAEEVVAADGFGAEAGLEFMALDVGGDGGELAELVDVLDGLGEEFVVAFQEEEVGGVDEDFAVFLEVFLKR